MNRKLIVFAAILAIIGGFAFAQDLKIDYQVNIAKADPANYLTFVGPIRYMTAEKDTLDATTGASKLGSTHFFQPYLLDVKGKVALSNGLRGLFLFAVAAEDQRLQDNLNVRKAADGTITVQFAHRGTAYGLISDKTGKFTFPNGIYRRRVIGYIQGAGPQVISRDFSSDGTAAKVDWAKVWNPNTPSGKEITAGVATKTGPVLDDGPAAEAMFTWDGALQVTFENNVLKIQGGLNAVKR